MRTTLTIVSFLVATLATTGCDFLDAELSTTKRKHAPTTKAADELVREPAANAPKKTEIKDENAPMLVALHEIKAELVQVNFNFTHQQKEITQIQARLAVIEKENRELRDKLQEQNVRLDGIQSSRSEPAAKDESPPRPEPNPVVPVETDLLVEHISVQCTCPQQRRKLFARFNR